MARPSAAIVEVEIHGLDELLRDLPAWERRTELQLAAATLRIATLTAQVTALRAPVLTGRFRASIRAERIDSPGRPAARVSEGEGLAYGRWLEFGRRKRGGKPKGGRYLLPTARREKRNVKKQLAATVQRSIDTYPWPNPKI